MKFDISNVLSGSVSSAQQHSAIEQIPIELLHSYSEHCFTLYTGERLDDMVQSIKKNGVLTPIIVRHSDSGYEILAGHNRTNAARIAGLTTVPAIVKNVTDEEAQMYVVETNLMQRGFSDLRLSEQAYVVALRHSKMFDKEKQEAIRAELAALEGENTSKLAAVGAEYGLGKTTVARLIRLNKLLIQSPLFGESVDAGFLSLRAAVELSYISSEALNSIFTFYKKAVNSVYMVKLDAAKAEKLRELFRDFDGTQQEAYRSLTAFEQGADTAKVRQVKVSTDVISRYFTSEDSSEHINDVIDKALEQYFNKAK